MLSHALHRSDGWTALCHSSFDDKPGAGLCFESVVRLLLEYGADDKAESM